MSLNPTNLAVVAIIAGDGTWLSEEYSLFIFDWDQGPYPAKILEAKASILCKCVLPESGDMP